MPLQCLSWSGHSVKVAWSLSWRPFYCDTVLLMYSYCTRPSLHLPLPKPAPAPAQPCTCPNLHLPKPAPAQTCTCTRPCPNLHPPKPSDGG